MDLNDLDMSFDLAGDSVAVQVFDFDQMEYGDYDDITFVDLQNVASNQLLLEISGTDGDDQQQTSEEIVQIPSYGSFVKELSTNCAADYFENQTNSTTIYHVDGEDIDDMIIEVECPTDCYCEACLQVYFNSVTNDFGWCNGNETSDSGDVVYVENVTNVDLLYDFTRIWNDAEMTAYMEFPSEAVCTDSTITTCNSVRELLRSKILARSTNAEERNDAGVGEAGFYEYYVTDS